MKTIADIATILSYYVCYESRCNKCEVNNICKKFASNTSYCPAVMVAREICKMLETGVYYG